MDSTETLTTLGNQEWAIKNGQYRDPDNKNGQYRDPDNIGHSGMGNTETLTTLGNQQWTVQRP